MFSGAAASPIRPIRRAKWGRGGGSGRISSVREAIRRFLAGYGLLLASMFVAACSPTASNDPVPPSRPNVIVYLVDTLRADHLGVYGYDRPTSPTIDRLAASGVVFENAYVQDTRTLGSIPSLLASLYPSSHGILRFGQKLAGDAVTLAEVFSAEGYRTASFITNVNAGKLPGLDRGFGHFHDAIRSANPLPLVGTRYFDRDAHRSFPEEAFFAWLDEASDAPFFAYVHTAEPHRPYNPPPPYDTLFDPGYEGEVTGHFDGPRGFGRAVEPADVAHVRALYDGEIAFADAAVGKLLAGLESRGLAENTLVVVTADHGEELRDRGGWNHGHSVYNELLRVPLVMAGPGIRAGTRIEAPVQLVDVAPTVLGRANLSSPPSFEGDDLSGLLDGSGEAAFSDRAVFAMSTQPPTQFAVIQGGWKAIIGTRGAPELYDLTNDPGETRNLAETHTEKLQELLDRLREKLASRKQAPRAGSEQPLSSDDESRLRALGYIE
jgi:arylsulfatase A-like enzyme